VHRIVQIGRSCGNGVSVEVLSGLKEGEEIAETPAAPPAESGKTNG